MYSKYAVNSEWVDKIRDPLVNVVLQFDHRKSRKMELLEPGLELCFLSKGMRVKDVDLYRIEPFNFSRQNNSLV